MHYTRVMRLRQSAMQTHEPLTSFRKVSVGSNRKFGLVWAGIFCLVGLVPVLHSSHPRWGLISLAIVSFLIAIFRPHWLTWFNRAWFRVGLALNAVVSPLVMGVLFFGAVTPLAIILRKRGTDLLSLARSQDQQSYWNIRNPPGPAPGTMTKQF